MSKEPNQSEMNEFLLTRLLNQNLHMNSKNCQTTPADFKFPDLWKTEEEKSDDVLIDQFSGDVGVKIHRKKS